MSRNGKAGPDCNGLGCQTHRAFLGHSGSTEDCERGTVWLAVWFGTGYLIAHWRVTGKGTVETGNALETAQVWVTDSESLDLVVVVGIMQLQT